MKIVLASTSPRRKEIMKKIGLPFIVEESNFIENLSLDIKPKELVKNIPYKKAEQVAKKHKKAIVIEADTIIVVGQKILGKPYTKKKAKEMLKLLNGKLHRVITGFTIINTDSNQVVSHSVTTKVYFKKLTSQEINAYINSGEPLDKAGGYAIQGLGKKLIKKIEGDYYNVMGLPLETLIKNLELFGVKIKG